MKYDTDVDIASFAEQLIEQESKELKTKGIKLVNDPVKGAIKVDAPDISAVNTSDSLINSILEQSFGIKAEPTKPVAKPVVETKKSIEDYTKELMGLINQAKNLINEMTTCGSIGVATVEPQPKKKKKIDKLAKFKLKYGLK